MMTMLEMLLLVVGGASREVTPLTLEKPGVVGPRAEVAAYPCSLPTCPSANLVTWKLPYTSSSNGEELEN